MSAVNDFFIKNGVLKKYKGSGGDVIIPDSVTSIEQHAFASCSSLTSVTIPGSVTSIGNHAFYYCKSLTSITILGSVTSIEQHAFASCSSLTSVTIPDSVTSIGNHAFYYCKSLTSITIPGSVTRIGKYAFEHCESLTSVTIPGSMASIEHGTFGNCKNLSSVTISDGVTRIGENAFWNCQNLTSVTIPGSVTNIEAEAFAHCSSLTRIIIPDSVTSIEHNAFRGCGLTSVTIPGSLKSIEKETFYECRELTSVTIKDGVERIGIGAFAFCSSLMSVNIPDSVVNIDNYAFPFCGLTSVTIPDNVTSIGDYAFEHCSSLRSVTIPGSVTSIGGEAFRECRELKNVIIPDSVTSIDIGAFSGCGLTEITIPDSVMYIGSYTFLYCNKLEKISINGSISKIDSTALIRKKVSLNYPNDDVHLPNLTVIVRGKPGPALLKLFSRNRSQIDHIVFSDDLLCSELPVYVRKESTLRIAKEAMQGRSIPDQVYKSYLRYIAAHTDEWFDDLGSDNFPVIQLMLREKLIKITEIDSLIQKVGTNKKNSEVINMLLEYQQKNFQLEDYDRQTEKEFRKIEKEAEIRSDPSSQKYTDTMWSVSTKNPTVVTSFRDAGQKVLFPSRVRQKSMTGIADHFTFKRNGADVGNEVTEIVIPDGYVSIGELAFSECRKLKRITIPDSVKNIAKIIFPNSLKELCFIGDISAWLAIDKSSWDSFLTYHHPVIHILNNNQSVRDFVIPEGISSIYENAFYGCQLESVVIPDSVISIRKRAFSNCSKLTHITIPDSVVHIGTFAFYGCSKLKDVSVPDSVVDIGDCAFTGCSEMADKDGFIIIKNELHSYEGKQKTVKIPDGVTAIRNYAFTGRTFVTAIVIPESVVSFGEGAFKDCNHLTDIVIPESVASIGDYAFENCRQLKNVEYTGDGYSWFAKFGTKWKDSPIRYGAEVHFQKGDYALPLSGLTFVVTGDLRSYPDRNDLKKKIECLGGRLTGSVSNKTNYVITNFPDSNTTKLQKARELNIPVIDEAEFLKMAGL